MPKNFQTLSDLMKKAGAAEEVVDKSSKSFEPVDLTCPPLKPYKLNEEGDPTPDDDDEGDFTSQKG